MNRKAKKSLFNKNSPKSNCKGFWDICQPLFSDKGRNVDRRIQLNENGKLISDEDHLAEIFNEFFNSITDRIEIPSWDYKCETNQTRVQAAIQKYEHHPSILKIIASKVVFSLNSHTLMNPPSLRPSRLNQSKSVGGAIPVRILKLAKYVCAPFLTACLNSNIDSGFFQIVSNLLTLSQYIRRTVSMKKLTVGPLVSSLAYPKFSRGWLQIN